MGEAAREEGKRTIKLFCPSVSKIVQIIEGEDQRLDLGFIARDFGLDPNTLKLNGHFISRGVDFIASSVTWKSLIGFFSARGLSTGGTDSDALLVHGKPSGNAPKSMLFCFIPAVRVIIFYIYWKPMHNVYINILRINWEKKLELTNLISCP